MLPQKLHTYKTFQKNGKRQVQGVPQSQTAAHPRHQEEDETNKTNKRKSKKKKYIKHYDKLSLPQARKSQCWKAWRTQEQNNTRIWKQKDKITQGKT